MIFKQYEVNFDSVVIDGVAIQKPIGVSVDRWYGIWESLREFMESGQPSLQDYLDSKVDYSEIEALEDKIEELKDENASLQIDLDSAENELSELQAEYDELKFRVDGLEK